MITFQLLIATIGRPTLVNQLESLVNQLQECDCLTVVFDGLEIQDLPIFKKFTCELVLYSELKALGYWGHGIRNKYASLLQKRDFVLHGDDDDIYAPNSIESIRNKCLDTDILYIARMKDPKLGFLPKEHVIRFCNIGTPCGIIPFAINQKAIWVTRHGGDADFYQAVQTFAKQVVFLDDVIYIVRP